MGRRRNAQRHEGGAVEVEDVNDKWWRVVGSDGSRARSSRPVPASNGRVLHRELLGGRNTARKLMCREIGQLRGRMPPRPDVNFCTEKFRRFKPEEHFFVHDGMEHRPLGTTTSITGITAANDFIFVVASSGVCMAFRHTKNSSIAPYRRDGQIWYFNNLGERIKLVFYNKINDSIIIVALTRHGIGYQTRALPLEPGILIVAYMLTETYLPQSKYCQLKTGQC
ncbi:hypothetical protein BDA96_10G088300 [Sorghum bicolor]|uniref:Uncharacterized protein n=2 Tax=Sorghum bicolor TaxID=4558 RepID=A0A921Q0C3_SORBI|nr:hypothetical protein BDA96_10G088300 [Sorghum bicolor]OQU76004.1 hypothetical protein SORBI_3010G073366 [Sorghum bicolor]